MWYIKKFQESVGYTTNKEIDKMSKDIIEFLSDSSNSDNDIFYQIQELLSDVCDADMDTIANDGFPLDKTKECLVAIMSTPHMYRHQKILLEYYQIVLDCVKYKIPYEDLEDLFLDLDVKYKISTYRINDIPIFHVGFKDLSFEESSKLVSKSINVISRRLPNNYIIDKILMSINTKELYDLELSLRHITL